MAWIVDAVLVDDERADETRRLTTSDIKTRSLNQVPSVRSSSG